MKTYCRSSFFALVLLAAAGCGDRRAPATEDQPVVSDQAEQSDGICGMLTGEQVDSVIPGNDGGSESDTSEEALFKDVEMGHCRYVFANGMDVRFLDFLTYTASSDEAFPQIEIGHLAGDHTNKKLDIGDVSFLEDMSSQNEMVVTASKGRTVVELKLIAEDAKSKSDALIELARIVVAKL